MPKPGPTARPRAGACGPCVLTDEDRAAIERGLDDMRQGRFASDEEVSAVFRRRG